MGEKREETNPCHATLVRLRRYVDHMKKKRAFIAQRVINQKSGCSLLKENTSSRYSIKMLKSSLRHPSLVKKDYAAASPLPGGLKSFLSFFLPFFSFVSSNRPPASAFPSANHCTLQLAPRMYEATPKATIQPPGYIKSLISSI